LTLKELLRLDMRVKENAKKLQNALLILPFFEDREKVNMSDLEKLVAKHEEKYPIMLSYIMPTPKVSGDPKYYSFMVKTSDTHEHVDTIYALSMFEGFAKVLLLMYSWSKKYKDGKR